MDGTVKQRGNRLYKTGGVEPVDLYESGGILRPFAVGCIIKYAFRNRRKTSYKQTVEDMEKIKHYADMIIGEAARGGDNARTKAQLPNV